MDVYGYYFTVFNEMGQDVIGLFVFMANMVLFLFAHGIRKTLCLPLFNHL